MADTIIAGLDLDAPAQARDALAFAFAFAYRLRTSRRVTSSSSPSSLRALVIGSSRSGAVGVTSLGSGGELPLHAGGAPVAVVPNDFTAPAGREVSIGVA